VLFNIVADPELLNQKSPFAKQTKAIAYKNMSRQAVVMHENPAMFITHLLSF